MKRDDNNWNSFYYYMYYHIKCIMHSTIYFNLNYNTISVYTQNSKYYERTLAWMDHGSNRQRKRTEREFYTEKLRRRHCLFNFILKMCDYNQLDFTENVWCYIAILQRVLNKCSKAFFRLNCI